MCIFSSFLLVCSALLVSYLYECLCVGDMEFKQNKFLPPEKQIVTSNPDINVVSPLNAGTTLNFRT